MLLNYQEYGQGRPIMILHGLFGSARNWQGIARSLAENHRISNSIGCIDYCFN